MLKKLTAILLVCAVMALSIGVAEFRAETGQVYLPENLAETAIDFTFDDLTPLKAINFEDYKVIFVGEWHYSAMNPLIMLAFIQFLNENYGVRHIIYERSYSEAFAVNEFLRTGDIELIYEKLRTRQNTQTVEMRDFYVALYEWNKTLPKDRQVMFVGIDVHTHLTTTYILRMFEILLPEDDDMPEIVAEVAGLLVLPDDGWTAFRPLSRALGIIEGSEDIFREYMGERYYDLYFGVRSAMQLVRMRVSGESNKLAARERLMHENFALMYHTFGMERSFGMFGAAHTELDSEFFFAPDIDEMAIAHYLNNVFEPTVSKVMNIEVMYHNSYLTVAGEVIPIDQESYRAYCIIRHDLAEIAAGDLAIFSTDGIVFDDKPLADKAQFILLLQNSPGMTLLE